MTGIELIAAERQRQVEQEGWSAEHDDQHRRGELAAAAACYASYEPIYVERAANAGRDKVFRDPWPWSAFDGRKRHDKLRKLAIAGALIAAEIDRIQRADAAITQCQAGRDGECNWRGCPQIRDGEPAKTGRHCPIDCYDED